MTEERLKEIKDSINIEYVNNYCVSVGKGIHLIHLEQELELYNEVIRLREENEKLRREYKVIK